MPTKSNKAKVRADIKNNLLVISFEGSICAKQLEGVYTDIRFNAPDLKPGFIVINDLSRARIGHLSGIGTFRKIMAFLAEHKVGAVIRIVAGNSLILKQVSRIVSALQGYSPLYVNSMEDAMAKVEAIRSENRDDDSVPRAAAG